ncbi:MAG: hypothetical protein OER88_06445, partial [Planctomycetota bacterium]|nr:hypothetical protein [Planctomycetota bacterium]
MRLDFPELGRLRVERLREIPPPSADLWAGLGRLRGLAILDSAANGRYSVVAALPQVILRWRDG